MHEYDKQWVKIIMSKFEILQNNKIERGNHEALSKIEGTYKKMLDLQSGF